MDQGMEERGEVDEAVLPRLPGQPCPSATFRAGAQSRELLSASGPASRREPLVFDDVAGEADQNWREGGVLVQVRHVPVGRGRDTYEAAFDDPPANSAAHVAVPSARMTTLTFSITERGREQQVQCVPARRKSLFDNRLQSLLASGGRGTAGMYVILIDKVRRFSIIIRKKCSCLEDKAKWETQFDYVKERKWKIKVKKRR